jgi:RNA polymerase sigma-70 factor (ECF subfamily)
MNDELKAPQMTNEEHTIILAREGSLDAFHRIYQKHWDRIWRIAIRYTSSGADAEDIVQETFVRAFERMHTYNIHRSSSFDAWLNTICLNCTMDFFRRWKRRKGDKHLPFGDLSVEPSSSNPSPDQEAEGKQVLRKIQESLQLLSPRQRIIFDMRFNQQMDIREIAQCLRCSKSNIKTQIFRSLRKLRKTLEPIWGKP